MKRKAVLLMHGENSSTLDWLQKTDWPLKLVELGYDVWMGNSSGTQFTEYNAHGDSQVNERFKWDFDWSDMGISDLPPMIETIRDVTQLDKITFIGHGQGNA
jgi:lysosomal acid lipase/cholesteryl ester hydrolase